MEIMLFDDVTGIAIKKVLHAFLHENDISKKLF